MHGAGSEKLFRYSKLEVTDMIRGIMGEMFLFLLFVAGALTMVIAWGTWSILILLAFFVVFDRLRKKDLVKKSYTEGVGELEVFGFRRSLIVAYILISLPATYAALGEGPAVFFFFVLVAAVLIWHIERL